MSSPTQSEDRKPKRSGRPRKWPFIDKVESLQVRHSPDSCGKRSENSRGAGSLHATCPSCGRLAHFSGLVRKANAWERWECSLCGIQFASSLSESRYKTQIEKRKEAKERRGGLTAKELRRQSSSVRKKARRMARAKREGRGQAEIEEIPQIDPLMDTLRRFIPSWLTPDDAEDVLGECVLAVLAGELDSRDADRVRAFAREKSRPFSKFGGPISLDAPLDAEEPDGATIGDLVADGAQRLLLANGANRGWSKDSLRKCAFGRCSKMFLPQARVGRPQLYCSDRCAQKAYYCRDKERGVCRKCRKVSDLGGVSPFCASCRDGTSLKMAGNFATKARYRRKRGICITCGKRPSKSGILRCMGCEIRLCERSNAYHKRRTCDKHSEYIRFLRGLVGDGYISFRRAMKILKRSRNWVAARVHTKLIRIPSLGSRMLIVKRAEVEALMDEAKDMTRRRRKTMIRELAA